MSRVVDMIGKKFALLSIVERAGMNKQGYITWKCICDCGNTVVIAGHSIRQGRTKSCGCLTHLPQPWKTQGTKTHGMSGTPTYNNWVCMIQRCTNPKHKDFYNYGKRGVTVCERWLGSFANFLADMGTRPTLQHSIDRIDSNGNYEPSNCRWATPKEQGANKRKRKKTV